MSRRGTDRPRIRVHPGDTPTEPSIAFALKLAHALHTYGAPAHRLEEALQLVCGKLGIEGQFFSMPTSILAAFGALDRQRTFLLRVQPGGVNLEKQSLLHEVVSQVAEGRMSVAGGAARVDAIEQAAPRYGPIPFVLCHGVASAAAAVFFGGGLEELLVAATIGLVTGVIAAFAERSPRALQTQEVSAAIAASAIATFAAWLIAPLSAYVATVAGLIVLMPGLTLTTAMTELGTRNLASGTARFAAACVTFLTLGFGVALGGRLGALLPDAAGAAQPTALPDWAIGAAVVAGALSFTVLLRARPRDAGIVVTASVLAYVGARAGTFVLGPELGMFLAALTVGVTGNLWSRVFDRPSAVYVVPGIIMLVPGSVGFRSLSSLMHHDVVTGIETAVTVATVAVALAAGLLVANTTLAPRRAL